MLTLIHGDDTASSRKALQEEKAKYADSEIVALNAKQIGMPELTLATDSNSLFATPKLIILENLLKGPPSKEKTTMTMHISSPTQIHNIIVWEDRKIEGAALKKYFSKAKIYSFDFPAQLFKFLDSIGPNKSKEILLSFHDLLKKEEAELVFVMVLRQFRYMIMAKDLKGSISELAPWQGQKFYQQSSFFSLENLIFYYRQLISIDYRIKTGQTPLALAKLLDLFFISL